MLDRVKQICLRGFSTPLQEHAQSLFMGGAMATATDFLVTLIAKIVAMVSLSHQPQHVHNPPV